MYDELGGLFCRRFSLTHCRTVGGSKIRSLSIAAEPARLSARSFPVTPACPGLKIHVTFSSALFRRGSSQSAYMYSFPTFCKVLMESVTMTALVYWLS